MQLWMLRDLPGSQSHGQGEAGQLLLEEIIVNAKNKTMKDDKDHKKDDKDHKNRDKVSRTDLEDNIPS